MLVTESPTSKSHTSKSHTSKSPTRKSVDSRRFGYLLAVLINLAVLYVIYAQPGWEELPILTDDTSRVLGLVTFSIIAVTALNLLYIVADPKWLTTLGGLVTTVIGLAALVRIWQVFPFDFADSPNWAYIARVVLMVGIVGSAIGAIAQFGSLIGITARVCAGATTSTRD